MYYDEHVKRQAVRLVVREGLSLSEVSRRFGIKGHSTLSKWIAIMDKKDLRLAESLVEEDRELILKAWDDYFGK